MLFALGSGFRRRIGVRADFVFRPLGRPSLANAPKEGKGLAPDIRFFA
jgi:hypothetical protein